MKIGDLFVNLGIKGNEDAKKKTQDVKTGLSDVASSGLAAKAAIVGMIYALEKMMSASARTGTDLKHFTETTGLSSKTLQQWQYEALKFGVQGKEVEGSVRGIQKAMIDMLMGKGAPAGMAMVANKVGFDKTKARDTFYVLEQLRKYAHAEGNKDVANSVLESFGLGPEMQQMLRRSTADISKIKADIYSDKETAKLEKVGVGWSMLGRQIEMAFGHMTAKHGSTIITDLAKATPALIKMVEALIKLAETTKLIQGLGKIFEGWGYIFEGISGAINGITDIVKGSASGATDKEKQKRHDVLTGIFGDPKDAKKVQTREDFIANQNRIRAEALAGQKNKTQNTNITVHNHGVKDAKDGAHHVKKAVNDTMRQMSAQTQGS